MTLNPNWFLNATGQFTPIGSGQIALSTTTTTGFLTFLSNTISSAVSLSSLVYADGPSVAQGSSGTWFAAGIVTPKCGAGADNYSIKLWDGTSVAASCFTNGFAATATAPVSLQGVFSSPAGNIRISVAPQGRTDGTLQVNASGNNKDSTIFVVRIG